MKQTAVEWLIEKMQNQIDAGYGFNPKHEVALVNQAKEMEKQQQSYSEEEMLEFSEWFSHNDWVYLPSKGYCAGLKDQSNYVIEMPTHILTELKEQAKEMEEQQPSYSEAEVLEFTQTMIMQYKSGNTNIEQMDLLKETLQQFKNK